MLPLTARASPRQPGWLAGWVGWLAGHMGVQLAGLGGCLPAWVAGWLAPGQPATQATSQAARQPGSQVASQPFVFQLSKNNK